LLIRRLLLCLVAVLALSGCGTVPVYKVHYRLLEDQTGQMPAGNTLLLPLDIKVKEMTTGGITEVVPAWTDTAVDNFNTSIGRSKTALFLDLVRLESTTLTTQESQLLDQHLALNETVVGSAIGVTGILGGAAWSHKSEHFDYSIGPGLSFLIAKTGADKALVLTGEDVRSSSGRKAAFIALAMFGVGIPLGHTVTVADIIDLRSGDILWMNYHVSMADIGYLTPDHTDEILQALFKDYPGVEQYREWLSSKK